MTTNEFIERNRHEDVKKLALSASRFPDVDMPYALQQISGWQAAQSKLPAWASTEGLRFPKHISMEQCSSETTARYKAQLATRWMNLANIENSTLTIEDSTINNYTFVDLTGGFGVDFSYMAKAISAQLDKENKQCKMLFVEQQEELCDIALHNFPLLGIENAEVCCADSVKAIDKIAHADIVFLDPARRNLYGARTYSIADCTPNILELQERLLNIADTVIVKLSPMLDYHKAIADLACVREVHIVGTKTECKELLFVMSRNSSNSPVRLFCSIDGETLSLSLNDLELPVPIADTISEGMLVCEPSSCLMKTGAYGFICKEYNMKAIAQNSHLFVKEQDNDTRLDSFMRTFVVKNITTMNKRDLRQAISGIERANIAVRNFPMSAPELRKRLKMKDGGTTYIFGTTDCHNHHIIIICERK